MQSPGLISYTSILNLATGFLCRAVQKKKNFKFPIVDKTIQNANFIEFLIVNPMGIMF
jgi:hypothetical protein